MPIIRSMPALTRPRIRSPSKVTTGRSCAIASNVVLPPDQPMLSSMTSHWALAAAKRLMLMASSKTQWSVGLEAVRGKRAVEPLLEQLGHAVAHVADEHELAVAGFLAMRGNTSSYCGRYLNSDCAHQ